MCVCVCIEREGERDAFIFKILVPNLFTLVSFPALSKSVECDFCTKQHQPLQKWKIKMALDGDPKHPL